MWPGFGRAKAQLTSTLVSSHKLPRRITSTPMCHRIHNDFLVRTQHSGRGKAPLPKGASPSATPFPLLSPGCFHRGPRAKVPSRHLRHSTFCQPPPIATHTHLLLHQGTHNDFLAKIQHAGRGKAPLQEGASPSATPFPLLSPGCFDRKPCAQASLADTKLISDIVSLPRRCQT